VTLLLVSAPILSQTRADKWRQDLQYLAAALPRTHPNLFVQMTQVDFTQAVAQLNDAIPSKADYEIMVEMARIVALAGDGHTSLDLRQNRAALRSYPLRLYWFDDGLFVIKAAANNYRALGRKLVQIGDTPIDRAYAAVSTLISHDARYFVLDLRNNEGGNDAVILPLLQGLQQAIAQGVVDPASQVFVITGRETFSSGMNDAIQFKSLGVTLVGEPTGGKPNHFGSPTTIILPNSGLFVNCSTRVIQFPGFDGTSLVPDIPVNFTVSDYLAERDPALVAILSRAR
jgi:hypothetical protein